MRFPRYSHTLGVAQNLPAEISDLRRIAENLYWSWNHDARNLFREIDRELWDIVEHNPIKLILRAKSERLQELAKNEDFVERVQRIANNLDDYLSQPATNFGFLSGGKNQIIAYFCAEFGITESLPIYSGGLGILAGDHLKAASDLGIPLVGVGLLYSRGYFRQRLNSDGWQQEEYLTSDFHNMPISIVRGEDNRPITIKVEVLDRIITCQIWKAIVGKIELYLLDSNVLENAPGDQNITDTLYGGDQEMRLCQEIILGIGGMRALRAVGKRPDVCHMNEGHAAFLTIERIRQVMEDFGTDFRTARKIVVSSNVFTTHTPVPAGFDLFAVETLQKYVGHHIAPLGITFEEFAQLGKLDQENEGEAFNMAVFAMENANYLNGVAKLHAKVTRGMFHSRWPGYPEDEVPIQAVTNGIHTTTWISQPIAELLDRAIGLEWRSQSSDSEIWNRVWQIDDRELWETKATLRKELVRFSRSRLKSNLKRRGATPLDLMEAETVLDPDILTIGFARRFATYKRAALMLSDKDRLKAILYHPERPVQIVIAGKSHPKDDGGKKLIQELVTFMKDEGARSRMVFLEDYDMEVARRLVQGVDVWLNNPRRPHEASGTSGMKVVPNGGLNCSVLDGWWDEAYEAGIGWAIGDERQFPDESQQDWIDSQALYHLIESEIGPKFYNRNHEGLPHEWIHMMKRSMAQHSPQFSTARMVSDYARNFYVPAWNAFQALTTNGLSRAQAALDWRARIRTELPKAKFVSTNAETSGEPIVGAVINFQAEVALGSLSPNEVDVQLVYGPVESSRDIGSSQVLNMSLIESEAAPLRYETSVQLESAGEIGYAFRIVPKHEDIVIPAELNCVVWQNGG